MSESYRPPGDDPFAPPPEPIMPARPRDQLSDHEYDGIREYDNPTPAWWTAVFVASVFFAVFYFVFYHSGVPERSIYDGYDEAVSDNAKKTLARLGIGDVTPTQANMLYWMTKPEYLAYGRGVFKAKCVSCHGSDGEGKIGPNFTDDYYKNVKKLTDIPRVIANGAANGNMPSQASMGQTDVSLVSAYVASLRGKNLPGFRLPQGEEKIDPWPPLPAPSAAAPSQPAKK